MTSPNPVAASVPSRLMSFVFSGRFFLLSTLLVVFFLWSPHAAFAQQPGQTYTFSDQSSITVSGTSTIHDWNCDVNEFSGKISGVTWSDNDLENIREVSLTIPVDAFECGKNTMNRKLREAFRIEDHPEISFSARDIQISFPGETSDSESGPHLDAQGRLSMAGSTQQIDVSASGSRRDERQLTVTGEHSLDMTTYNMEPPTAIFGTIKTGEIVTVHFEIWTENE